MMRAASGLPFSGAGIGLLAPGVLSRSNAPASVTGTTSNTVVTTDTIPAGTLKVGDLLESFGIVSKTGTGTVILRVQLSDGTNAVQFVGTTSGSGAVQLQAGNRFALLATKSQSSISVGTPFSSGTTAASTLDESKAWTVQWSLQQSVPSDTSTLVFRNTTLTR